MLLRRQQGVQRRWTSKCEQHTSASLAFEVMEVKRVS